MKRILIAAAALVALATAVFAQTSPGWYNGQVIDAPMINAALAAKQDYPVPFGALPLATSGTAGAVKPDGRTTAVTSGVLSVITTFVTVNADGTLDGTSYNVASVSKTGTGAYTVTFTNAYGSTLYTPIVSTGTGTSLAHWNGRNTGTLTIGTNNLSGTPTDNVFSLVIFGP